jgi:hypothetical protein
MRSPAPAFDLRAALTDEVERALVELTQTPLSMKAVHRCRVHLKRARALARVGRACAPGLSAVFNESARSVMHALSQARDLSALAQSARYLSKREGRKVGKALTCVADNLEAAVAALPPPPAVQIRMGVRDLLALAQVWPEASPRQIEKGAARVARRARHARRNGRGARETALRHEWRKREKDRFYAVDMLGKAWPEDRPRRRLRSAALGHVLGEERDLLLLMARIEATPTLAGDDKAAARALKALSKRRAKLAKRGDEMGARLHAGSA